MSQRLKGRVALVTGASRGVGRVVALALAREGADLVLASKTIEPHPKLKGTLPEVAAEAETLGVKALVVQMDARFPEQVENVADQALSKFGSVDILVNNAGALFLKPLLETPLKRLELVHALNFRAPFQLCQLVLPGMIERRWGHIINMSPPIKADAAAGKIAYLNSKYGMTLITHGLAEEVRAHNVAVHSLWPACVLQTAATEVFGLGTPEVWRKPQILADATLSLVTRDPSVTTGRAWLDEDLLSELEDVTDFTPYACVEGGRPMRLDW